MKKTIAILFLITLFGFGCAKPVDPKEVTVNPPVGNAPLADATVEYREGGFNPPVIRIIKGTKVVFVNKSDKLIQLKAEENQSICSDFDSKTTIKKGASYSYTFDAAGNCNYFNKLKSEEKGSVNVRTIEQN